MTENPPPNIYEETFAKSDKTDAVLLVDGKKLHVNKALLSYHSDYFNTLFNSNFKEKSMEEIPIDDVIFEDFAALLSLVHEKPIKFIESDAENLLELADRFLLPAAKRHLEVFVISSSKSHEEKIRIADKYKSDVLMKHAIRLFSTPQHFQSFESTYNAFYDKNFYKSFREHDHLSSYSDETRQKLFYRALEVVFGTPVPIKEAPARNIYEETFAKTDKTDAILLIEGKKLHVNKAILSYYSDFFNTLFNSDFKEKSMEEIPIDDVIFEDFAAFLSLVQCNPIMPTESNVEKILELSDRFLLPSVKRHVELFLLPMSKDRMEKIRIGDKYRLEDLIIKGISMFTKKGDFKDLHSCEKLKKLSAKTTSKLMTKFLTFRIV